MIASSSTIAITTETSTSEKPACAGSIVFVRAACALRRPCAARKVCEALELWDIGDIFDLWGICNLCGVCGLRGGCGLRGLCRPRGPHISVPGYVPCIFIMSPSLHTADWINVQPCCIDSRCNGAERLLAGMEQRQRTTQVVDRAVMPQTDREHARHRGQQKTPAQYGRLPRHGDQDVP